jgi:hypothetical protein
VPGSQRGVLEREPPRVLRDQAKGVARATTRLTSSAFCS